MTKGQVVVTDGGVVATDRESEIITMGVFKEHAFQVLLEVIAGAFLENQVGQESEAVRDVRGDEEIDLTEANWGCRALLGSTGHAVIAKAAHVQERAVGIDPFRSGSFALRGRRCCGRDGDLTWRRGNG